MRGSERFDPYTSEGGASGVSVGRVLARLAGVLVGLGISFLGFGFYMLRCFSTCPTDPAENLISQILTLSLLGFGIVLVMAAASLGTRSAVAGSWIITLLGAAMAIAGLATLVLAPSLRLAGDRTGAMMLGVVDVAAGAGVALFGRWVRSRNEQQRSRSGL